MRKVNKWMSLLLFLFVFAVCQSYKKVSYLQYAEVVVDRVRNEQQYVL